MASYSGRRLCTSYVWVTLVYTLPLSAMRTVLGNGWTIRQPHPPIMYHMALKPALPKTLLIENHHRHGHRPCLIQKTFLPMIQCNTCYLGHAVSFNSYQVRCGPWRWIRRRQAPTFWNNTPSLVDAVKGNDFPNGKIFISPHLFSTVWIV